MLIQISGLGEHFLNNALELGAVFVIIIPIIQIKPTEGQRGCQKLPYMSVLCCDCALPIKSLLEESLGGRTWVLSLLKVPSWYLLILETLCLMTLNSICN